MKIPKSRICIECGALLYPEKRYYNHNVGDLPDWMENRMCKMSGEFVSKKERYKDKNWWSKYTKSA